VQGISKEGSNRRLDKFKERLWDREKKKRKLEKEQKRMVDIFKKLKKKKQNQTAEKERRDTKTVLKLKKVGNSLSWRNVA
jgi:hypothetical protein